MSWCSFSSKDLYKETESGPSIRILDNLQSITLSDFSTIEIMTHILFELEIRVKTFH